MKHFLVLCATLLIFAGCKYDKPLTEKPTRNIDPSLLGSWVSVEEGKPLRIYRLSNTEYLVIDNGDPYVCTHSDVAGTNFISCRQLKNDKEAYGKYAYAAYKMKKGELILYPLSDSLKEMKDDIPQARQRELIVKAAQAGTALDTTPGDALHFRRTSSK